MPQTASGLTQATRGFGLKPKDPPSDMQPLCQISLPLSVLGGFSFEAPRAVFQYTRKTFFFCKEAARDFVVPCCKGKWTNKLCLFPRSLTYM